jgi:hypothetical protein
MKEPSLHGKVPEVFSGLFLLEKPLAQKRRTRASPDMAQKKSESFRPTFKESP